MTQTATVRPFVESAGSAAPRVTAKVEEVVRGETQWRCLSEHRQLVDESAADWWSLSEGPGRRRVKRNGHRDVWRIDTPAGSYFVKRYRSESVIVRLKGAFRGPMASLEWDVGHYAARHDIASVLPVACGWRGPRAWPGPSLLITQAVPGGMPLCDFWLEIRDDVGRSRSIARQVARLVARAHQCGFHHLDMHAGNILVRTEGSAMPQALFVDLHNVRIGRTVAPSDVIANLAQLNQWFRRHATRTQRLVFLRAYLLARDEFAQAGPYARNWTIEPRKLLSVLNGAARRHAERLWSKRDRRSMRTGRYFARLRPERGWKGHVLLQSKHPRAGSRASRMVFEPRQWRKWLGDPASWADPEEHVVLKDSHSAIVCRAELATAPQALPVLVKRPRPRTLIKRLVHAMGPSRNLRAWRRANMLLNRDLSAAQPLAVVERWWAGFLRLDSILITEWVEDSVDLETIVARELSRETSGRQRELKDRLIAALARLVRDLAERGFAHRDFKAPNVLVRWMRPFEDEPELTLIDMDGIHHRGGRQIAAADRAVVRLNVSLSETHAVTWTDRLRFLRSHLVKTRRRQEDWKSYWRAFAGASARKQQQKELRRLWKLSKYGRE